MYKLYIEKNISSKDLLKRVLKELNISDEIIYNEYGKPYLKNNEIYFNISHSGEYTILGLSSSEIGVDIEKIRPIKENVINKVCTDDEKKLIKNDEDFTLIWVKKESYVKWVGMGIGYGLKNVDTTKITNFIIKRLDNYYISVYIGNK